MINCIQQIGLGVADKSDAFQWVRKAFGMNIPIFDNEGEPEYMVDYTGNVVQRRDAVLAESLRGGSAFEVWQYLSRTPVAPSFAVMLGDLGILLAKIKAPDVGLAYNVLQENGIEIVGQVIHDPQGKPHFFVKDPFGNTYQVVQDEHFFTKRGWVTGGVCGCLIGVSDIERALTLYKDLLGFDRVLYDEEGVFEDVSMLPGGKDRLRRILLVPSKKPTGAFARLIGPGQIELVQALKRKPRKLFGDRFWGDLGFIHLCFDVHDMQSVKIMCKEGGFPFTVDSNGPFDMDATGHFGYIEDPDSTLIEFVEVYKMSLLHKLNKRDPQRPLPGCILRLLSLGRVKD